MKIREKRKISYILIVILIFFSQNTICFSALASGSRSTIRNMVYISILILMFFETIRNNLIDRHLMLCFGIFFSAVMISMIFHGDSTAEYWVIAMLLSFFLVSNYDMMDCAQKYNQIMKILCICFLSGYFLLYLRPGIILSPIWLELEKLEIVCEHSAMLPYYESGIVPMRAYGIFREPGVYQMYVILALLICLYMKKKFGLELLIYSLAVFTAHSTTGYICLALVYGLFLLRMLKKKDQKAVALLGAIILGGVVIAPSLISRIMAKFTATGINAHSWMSRVASFATNIYLWLMNPLLGIGMNGVGENFSNVTQEVFGLNAGGVSITDNTNSILIYFAAYGLIPGIIFCVGIWKSIRKLENSWFGSLIVMIVFVFLFAGEQINCTCYPYMLIFYGLETKYNRIPEGVKESAAG